MKVNVRLENPLLKESNVLFSREVRLVAETVIYSNRTFLRLRKSEGRPVLPLLEAGVVYENEPVGLPDEAVDVPIVLQRGHGDCLHLSCWLVAEMREAGERAEIHVVNQNLPDGFREFHVMVRDGRGKVIDPSRLLGMK